MRKLFSMSGQKEVVQALTKTLTPDGELPLIKGLEFDIKGETIKKAIQAKMEAAKTALMLYAELAGAQLAVPAPANGQDAPKVTVNYQWRIEGQQNMIARFERMLRHLDEKKNYKLSEFDLEYYGL